MNKDEDIPINTLCSYSYRSVLPEEINIGKYIPPVMDCYNVNTSLPEIIELAEELDEDRIDIEELTDDEIAQLLIEDAKKDGLL